VPAGVLNNRSNKNEREHTSILGIPIPTGNVPNSKHGSGVGGMSPTADHLFLRKKNGTMAVNANPKSTALVQFTEP